MKTADLLGRPVKTTDNIRDGKIVEGEPDARTLQSIEYSKDGLTAKVTDGAGRVTEKASDALGRPVKTVAPNGMTQLTAYNDAATPGTSTKTTATLPAGETDPAKAVVTSTETSDQAGRPVASAESYADRTPSAPSSQSYDGLGRVSQSLSGDVSATPAYDGPGGTVRTTTLTPASPDTFPGEKVTAGTKDDLTGAPVVKTLTPGTGGGTGTEGRSGITVVRDGAGRVTSETGQDGGKTVYTYTPGGQIRESVSPSGVKTEFAYEEKTGRTSQVTVTSADGTTSEKTAYTYHPETGRVTEVYSPDDRPGTLISYTYNADGKVLKAAYPDGTSVSQTFDNHGQRTSLTDTAGAVTVYTYNADGTLEDAVQHAAGGALLARAAYAYDGLGRITTVVRGEQDSDEQITTSYTYTGANQIRTEKTTRAGGSVITEAAYEYDSHGNLTHRTDTRPETTTAGTAGSGTADGQDTGQTGPGSTDAGTQEDTGQLVTTSTGYRYDAYNRLLGSEVKDQAGAVLSSTAYTLNVSGDVTGIQRTGPGGKTVTGHTIDPAGRLTAVTTDGKKTEQKWDSEGNLLTDYRGSTYTYDARNRPLTVTAPDGQKTAYTYWADGTRATATTDTSDGAGTAVRFHYTPDGTIANDTHTTTGAEAGVTASYLLGAVREARSLTGDGAEETSATGGGYLLHDRHGNTTALTAPGGTVRAAWHYTDYGQTAHHTGLPLTAPAATGGAPGAGRGGAGVNPFTYAGEYTNPETGTQYLKARTYNPADGRFTTRDTASLLNRFQAFDANPVGYTDPSGHTAQRDDAIISGLLIGMAVLSAIISIATLGTASALSIALTAVSLAADAFAAGAEAVAWATGTNQHDFQDPNTWVNFVAGGIGSLGAVGGVLNKAVKGKSLVTVGDRLAESVRPAQKNTPVSGNGNPGPGDGGNPPSSGSNNTLPGAGGTPEKPSVTGNGAKTSSELLAADDEIAFLQKEITNTAAGRILDTEITANKLDRHSLMIRTEQDTSTHIETTQFMFDKADKEINLLKKQVQRLAEEVKNLSERQASDNRIIMEIWKKDV
ncbi:RHS repeat domain-containing protein [Streptomyces sp. NPDC001774]